MSASDDTTDAVAEARQFISEMDAEGCSTLPSADIIQELLARIDDLEAELAAVMSDRELYDATRVLGDEVISLRTQLAAVTREREEAVDALVLQRDQATRDYDDACDKWRAAFEARALHDSYLQEQCDAQKRELDAVTRERDELRELLAKRVWAEAESDPEFVKAATDGKADIEAGRTVQWTPKDNANNRA